MKDVRGGVTGAVIVLYILVGLLQLAAIMGGLDEWTGMPSVVVVALALFLAYIPVVGLVLGVAGALLVWEWSIVAVAGLFGAPYVLGLLLYALGEG